MKSIDLILLTGLIVITACLIFMPRRINPILKVLLACSVLLALAQFLIHGYYWHYLPSYFLILIMVWIALFSTGNNKKILRRLLQLFLFCMLLASILPWSIFLPVPELTRPRGEYKVGTRIFRWIDSSRSEHTTSDLTDRRNVVVQAWYPTNENAQGSHSDYLDGMGNLPDKIGILPSWIFDHYGEINTNGILLAPISNEQNQWPVIIFLTGNGASRAFYTSLVAGLASHGYVVLAIDHPYEAMITQLANGKIVTTIENHLNDDPHLIKFMEGRLRIRIADIQFIVHQLGNAKSPLDNFLLSLDQNRIVIAGHSLGGATAAATMVVDSRIKAAANIDGTLYGELPKQNTAQPFLLIESKKAGGDRFERYEDGNQRFFKHFGGGYRFEITEADHYSFTDAPLLLAYPARFFTSRYFEFGNIPTKTHNATVDILYTFFSATLRNQPFDADAVAKRHSGIIRKPVK